LKKPDWFSPKMIFLYSVSVLGGLMLAYKLTLAYGMIPETDKPGIFTFVIVLAGANIGGAIGAKMRGQPQLDELDTEIFNKSIIHGFIVIFTLIGYQALTRSFLTPAEEVLAASGTVLLSMMLQFAIKNYNVGDYLP
jgi:hypothetical protein